MPRKLLILLVAGALACAAAGELAASSPARASSACPWLNPSSSTDARARAVLASVTLDDEIALVHQADYVWQYYGVAGHIPGNARLCIPDLVLNDAGQGVGDQEQGTTAFPAPIAQAASWDPGLQQRFGAALGREAWQKGVNVQLAPDVNIARVPLNGRNFEAFGEAPYLTGRAAAAEIQGIQSQHVIADVKHYAGNNQETNRMTVSSDVDERTLHEIYLPGFEAAVKDGRAGSVMCAYNKVNGVYMCEQPELLTKILKREFGFDGFVVSDWGGTHSTVTAANAGLDMEMDIQTGQYFGQALKDAVLSGKVPKGRLDDMVRRILRTMFRVGLFDDPAAAEPGAFAADVETADDVALSRTIAEEGTVLLKNAGPALPLGSGKRIAVIGEPAGPAGAANVYNGGGSSHIPELGSKADVVSPLAGMQQRALASGDTVVYADGSSTADAVAAATAADVAVVFAGQEDSEGTDRASLALTGGTCTLVGGTVSMPWLGGVKAVVEAWYPGQEDGNAIAAVLFGDVNPSGKLPETFPRSESQLPTRTAQQYPGVDGHAVYSEGLLVGYRWYDARGLQPLFPFGHGLSYTTFAYSGLSVAKSGGSVTVSFTVRNGGQRAGAEVAQVYVGDPGAAGEPPRQLKGFQKVFLQPGESRVVSISLGPRAFAAWDVASHQWKVGAGRYRVFVGSSSRDLRLSGGIDLDGQALGQ